MAGTLKELADYPKGSLPDASSYTFGIVVAEWNMPITKALYEGCCKALLQCGAIQSNIHTQWVPGSFELPMGARLMLTSSDVDAVICLGCVIKGETSHNEYINQAVAQGITQLGLSTGKPCIFGVLTPNDQQQALDRAGGQHGNKGIEAAITALKMADLAARLGEKKGRIGFSNSRK